MGLEVVVPGDGSDGGEFFEPRVSDARPQLRVARRAKVGFLVAVSYASVSCSTFRTQCWEDAMEQPWSNFASRVFQRCGKG